MKVFSLYFLLALLAVSVQATFFKGTKPDFVLILVFFYSIRYGKIKGMAYGVLAGLLIDFASSFILGPNIISKAFVGYIVTSVRQKLFQWNIIINTVMIAIFSIVDIFLVYVCLEAFAGKSFVNRSLELSIMQVVYTTVVSLILYPILSPEEDNDLSLQMRAGI